MSKEKQIEKDELFSILCNTINGANFDDLSEAVYKISDVANYRKQSEVIEEYRKKVYAKMEKYTVFGREYIQRIMREVEKEMKGGAE